jgi:hypothetical protein
MSPKSMVVIPVATNYRVQDTATGADTKGGTLKDKEFSKWK